MKPQDLRIGCYVKIRDTGEIVRVEALSRKKIRFFHGDDKSRSYYRKYSEIEPVLIYDHWQKIDCLNILWCDGYDDDKWYSYNINEWKYQGFKRLRYIHELQNLHYALTGEELEIEL